MAGKEWTEDQRAEASRKAKERHALRVAERETNIAEPDPAPAVDSGGSAPALGDPVPIKPSIGEPNLSPEEYAAIAAEVARRINLEVAAVDSLKRTQLIARQTEIELQRQRREAGLADYRDDIMEILIDVAPYAKDMVWDGKIYQHGHWYKVSRRVYDSMRETMARSWDAEERAGNPNRKFQRMPNTGTMNPMMRELRMDDGTLTVYGDMRINGRSGSIAAAPPPGVA